MAEEFDIDKVIPKGVQHKGEAAAHSEGEFNLSINNDEMHDQFAQSQDNFMTKMGKGLMEIPGFNNEDGEHSGLITSDEDF